MKIISKGKIILEKHKTIKGIYEFYLNNEKINVYPSYFRDNMYFIHGYDYDIISFLKQRNIKYFEEGNRHENITRIYIDEKYFTI